MTKGKREIVDILMERDGVSEAEASEQYDCAYEEFMAAITGESGMDPEDVLMEELGLEPDYIFNML